MHIVRGIQLNLEIKDFIVLHVYILYIKNRMYYKI